MTALAARLKEFQVALMLLTRLPAGRVGDPVPGLARTQWAFALVGLPVGAIVWGVHAGALASGADAMLAAVAAMGVSVLVTGGLHHDGLADYADGIGGGREPAHRLEIMRDSRIGSYGVLALIVTLGLWVASLAQVGAGAGFAAFVAIATVSRFAMVLLLDRLPPARAEGLGVQARGRHPSAVAVGAVTSGLFLLPLGVAGIAVAAVVLLVTACVGWQARRRIGGQTGDVLGAAQLMSETAGWVVLSLVLA